MTWGSGRGSRVGGKVWGLATNFCSKNWGCELVVRTWNGFCLLQGKGAGFFGGVFFSPLPFWRDDLCRCIIGLMTSTLSNNVALLILHLILIHCT